MRPCGRVDGQKGAHPEAGMHTQCSAMWQKGAREGITSRSGAQQRVAARYMITETREARSWTTAVSAASRQSVSSVHTGIAGYSIQLAFVHPTTGSDGGSPCSSSTGGSPSADVSAGPFDLTDKPRPKAELLMKTLRISWKRSRMNRAPRRTKKPPVRRDTGAERMTATSQSHHCLQYL